MTNSVAPDAPETVGAALARLLVDAGVRRFYSVPGESFLEVLDTVAHDDRARLISTRHESGAAFMAEADGKLTGVPAAAMATRAVGAANLSIGVHTARQDSTPMIVVLGQVPTSSFGREAFQEVDLCDFYRPLVKWSTTLLDPGRVAETVRRAVDSATTGRPGPVMIALPSDVSGGPAIAGQHVAARTRAPATIPPGETILALAARLAAAERPVVIAGAGARAARGGLAELASRFGLGVYCAFRRQDVFANDDPHYLGHLTLGAAPDILAPLAEADLVLVLGSRLSEVTTQSYRLPGDRSEVVHVDADPAVLASVFRPTIPVLADPALLVRELNAIQHVARTRKEHWADGHARYLAHSTAGEHLTRERGAMHPADVITALAHATPASAIVTNDAGNFSIFLHRYWRYLTEHSQIAPTSGAMGYAVPAAIGAALAGAGRPVLAVVGDGGFLMTGQEIETAVREQLPVVVVVMRNGLYGTIAMHQRRAFGRDSGVAIGDVDIAGFARSLGAEGRRASTPDELSALAATAFAHRKPTVIDVPIDSQVLTP